MRKLSVIAIWGMFNGVLLLNACNQPKPDLTIAVAANLQFVMAEIVADYEKETGQKVEIVTGSSGKLFVQISNGAPYDVFLSADTLFPSRVIKEGIATSNYEVFAHGALVYWSSDTLTQARADALLNPSKKWRDTRHKWAIANPETAPYGFATKKYLEGLNLYEELLPFQVQGESVAQVNQFIHARSVSFGFTSLSSVIAKKIDPLFWIAIDPIQYPLIQQTAIEVNPSQNSKKFMNFLNSPQAIESLSEQGYIIPKSSE